MSLTFKLNMVFSVPCYFFKPFSNLRHGFCFRINTEASISMHISARSTALLNAMFHVPLLYFEHLPLQRSLHRPWTGVYGITYGLLWCGVFISFVNSHSDGTHLLQRIQRRASDVMQIVNLYISPNPFQVNSKQLNICLFG